MKQVEKLDILLRTLYESRFEGYYPLNEMWIQKSLPPQMKAELRKLSARLKNDDFIDTLCTRDECYAQITEKGIAYCKMDSYTYKGLPILSNKYNFSFPDAGQAR